MSIKKAFRDLLDQVDGFNWYCISYGEKCYAFAVVEAYPLEEDVPCPPGGVWLSPRLEKADVWVHPDGAEMLIGDTIATNETQKGDAICEFIAQAFTHYQQTCKEEQPR